MDHLTFQKLLAAGRTLEEIAEQMELPLEVVEEHAFNLGIGMGVDAEFSKRLRAWSAEGFIDSDWLLSFDRSAGVYRVKFRIGSTSYDLSETQMEWLSIGVEAQREWEKRRGTDGAN